MTEKKMNNYEREWAIDAAKDYFSELEATLIQELEEVRRNRQRFEKVLDENKDAEKPDPVIAQYIEWNIHHVQQINLHHEKGVRAAVKLALAFDLRPLI